MSRAQVALATGINVCLIPKHPILVERIYCEQPKFGMA